MTQWSYPGRNTAVGCHTLLQGIFPIQAWTKISCIAGRFFTIWATDQKFIFLLFNLLVCYRAIVSLWILFFVCFKTIGVVLMTSQLLVQLSDPDHHLKAPHPFARYEMFPMDWGSFQDGHLSSPQVSFNLSLYILLGLWGHSQQYRFFALRSQIWSQLGSLVTENQRCGSLEPSQLHFFPVLPRTRFTPASH